jgi:hypothetical protein
MNSTICSFQHALSLTRMNSLSSSRLRCMGFRLCIPIVNLRDHKEEEKKPQILAHPTSVPCWL